MPTVEWLNEMKCIIDDNIDAISCIFNELKSQASSEQFEYYV